MNLPGMPDNISFNGKDTFWLALYTPRDPTTEILQANPFLKKVLLRIPRFLIDGATSTQAHAFVLGLDMDGNVVHNLQDPSGAQASYTTCAYEYDGMLHLGNTGDNAIKRLPVP